MPRSSRHKSKHSSRDAKEYSDSEKESGLREKKGKEDGGSSSSSRHLKDLLSSEKQKLDSKSVDVSKKLSGLGNAEYNDGYGGGVSSRKRKEKVDDDRWTGGDDNEHELSKSEIKEKEEVRGSSDSKRSSRRGVNYVSGFDVEEVKKSGSKGEGKHHRSEKKDRGEKEGGSERERKGSRSDRSEKVVDIVSVSENTSSKGSRKQSGSGEEHGGKRSSAAGKTEKVVSEKWVDIVSVNETTGSDGNKKLSGSVEERGGKHIIGNNDCIIEEEFKNSEPERDLDRRVRRKRDGSGDVERHHVVQDSDGRRVSSREEIAKSGKYKDDVHKVERHRESFQEDIDKDIWRQDEKQRDNRSTRDYASGKFDDKHSRNDKKDADLSHKKSMPHGGEYDRELDRERERDRDRDRDRDYTSGKFDDKHSRNDKKDVDLSHKKSIPHGGENNREIDHDREQDRDRDRGRDRDRDRSRLDHDRDREHDDRDHDRDRDQDRDYERVHDRDREHDRDRDHVGDRYRRELRGRVGVRDRVRDRDYDRGRDRNYEHEHDNDYALQVDEKGPRYKDDRGRRRSPDGYDDYHSDKLRRVKTEVDKERSLSQKPNIDSVTGSSQRRASPSSRSYFGADKYRDGVKDETKYGDTLRENNMPEAVERSPKYRSGEKRAKCDDNHIGEFSERSPNTRVSPAGFKERSPSSMSFDRSRFSTRNTRRRSLDVDDTERRISGSNDVREMGVTEDRQNLPSKKFLGDEYPKPESPFYNKNKSGQGNVSAHGPGSGPSQSPGPSVFRTRTDSPSFVGSYNEDNRGPGNRYRRSVDPNVGRGPGNAWNGVPNWPSPLPNGLIPFPPGPPGPHHGGFPPMMSQFPPLYGVRPTLDMNHQGIPYHVADGDRFPVHARPIAWPNMMDGPMPHFHGWDGGNGNSSMYGPGPGHLAQRRDINSDMWKQNGDMNMDVISGSQKPGPSIKASTDDASSAQGVSKANAESGCVEDQATSFKKEVSSGQSPVKELLPTPGKGATDKTPESSGVDDTAQLLRAYLARVDVSMDLVAPELYNQCVNLAFKGDSECGEDGVELELIEEKAVVESEITNLTVDMKVFPAAKESVFQRAMNLYKTQSSERRNSVVRNGDEIHIPSPSLPEVEQTSLLKGTIDSPAAFIIKQEQTLILPEEIAASPTTWEGKDVKPVSMTADVVNGEPLQNSDFSHDVGNETQMSVPVAVKMEEDTLGLVPENVDKGDLSVETTNPDPIISNADDDIVIDGAKLVTIDSVPEDQSDILVSGPLNFCNDSVKVCEGLTSVSDESESVVLSRIHHAPESTH